MKNEKDEINLFHNQKQLTNVFTNPRKNFGERTKDEQKGTRPPRLKTPTELLGDKKINFGDYKGSFIMATAKENPDFLDYLRTLEFMSKDFEKNHLKVQYQFIQAYLRYLDSEVEYNRMFAEYTVVRTKLETKNYPTEMLDNILRWVTKEIMSGQTIKVQALRQCIANEDAKFKELV